jgi:Flp pilus assembly protein TadD
MMHLGQILTQHVTKHPEAALPCLFVAALLMLAAAPTPVVRGQQIRPPGVDAQFHRATVAWNAGGSLLEAKVRLDNVLDAIPDDVPALILRSRVLLEMGRYEESLSDARRAAALRPEEGETHLVVCRAARRLGQDSLAVEALAEAARLLQPDPVRHVELSVEALELGRLEEAEAVARVAVALAGSNPEAVLQLSRVFVARGRTMEAATVLSGAVREGLLEVDRVRRDSALAAVGLPAIIGTQLE